MQNSNQVLGNKFDNLHFHAKSYVKRKKNKNQVCTSLKRQVMQSPKLETFMKNLGLKQDYIGSNFDNLYFHAKFQVKSKIYYKIKYYTSLKNYVMQNSNQVLGNKFDNPYFHTKSQIKKKS